jgi:predicted dehydrogenase
MTNEASVPAAAAGGPVRIAMVGMGWAGTRQTEAALEVPDDVEVVALVDNDPAFLAERAQGLGVGRTYGSLEEALRDDDVEAVSICTPHRLHAPQTHLAIEAGRHVLVEKPMAMTVAEASGMVRAAETARLVLYVAESECYMPYARTMRAIVESREPIGQITFGGLVSGYRQTDPRYPGRREWLTLPELGGTGTWYLQGVHAIAALRYVLGEVSAVHVRQHRTDSFERPDLEATMSAFLELENGLGVWFTQTTETNIPRRLRGFQLYGERGVVVSGRLDTGYDLYLTKDDQDAEPEHVPFPDGGPSEYALELQAFAHTIRGRAEGPTTGRVELGTMAVLEAGVESSRDGRTIVLRERFPELTS